MKKQRVKTRPVRWDILPVGLVLLLAAALFFGFWGAKEESEQLTAVISISGQEVARIRLSELQEPADYTVDGAVYPLTFRLTAEGAAVLESACPGQDCLHTGTVDKAGESIVCLPNQLILRLEGTGHSGVDAVVG